MKPRVFRASGCGAGVRRAPLLFASALAVVSFLPACSNYFGSGVDPARDGRVDGGTAGAGEAGFGGAGSCDDLQALGIPGNAASCPSLLACLQRSCDGTLSACFGNNYPNQDLSGGSCAKVVSCAHGCGCGSNCVASCNTQASCSNCLEAVRQCERNNCASELAACSGGGGGEGGGGGASALLVADVAVNGLALDADTVYFTSNQGLAKVAKKGGMPVPLGGFSQLNGLAVDARAIYAVNGDGSLISVRKDGGGSMTLAIATCGGGSGAIALDAGNVFFTTGPYLRTTLLSGGTPSDLASDVWQAGGPATSARLALDAERAYYPGNSNLGGQGALYAVARLDPGGVSCMGGNRQGTRVAAAKGSIAALIGDGARLYFTDLTSNGLSPQLVVSAVLAPSLSLSTVTDLATLSASNNSSPNAGNALASDGTYLYFSGFSGIYRVLVAGPSCKPQALPCAKPELVVAGAMATALAVDDAFLYYGDQNGPSALRKIAK